MIPECRHYQTVYCCRCRHLVTVDEGRLAMATLECGSCGEGLREENVEPYEPPAIEGWESIEDESSSPNSWRCPHCLSQNLSKEPGVFHCARCRRECTPGSILKPRKARATRAAVPAARRALKTKLSSGSSEPNPRAALVIFLVAAFLILILLTTGAEIGLILFIGIFAGIACLQQLFGLSGGSSSGGGGGGCGGGCGGGGCGGG